MRVHLYSIVWNEEEMLPFFFRHYDSLVDRYVIYDDGSTDRRSKCWPRTIAWRCGHSCAPIPIPTVMSGRILHDNVWKESRGHADWVIITAVDEHLYHPAGLK